MQLESLSEILTCIKNWQTIRGNEKELSICLNKARFFSYKLNNKESDNLHIYPGISWETKTFYMFLIDQAADREQDEQALYEAINQCVVKRHLGNADSIPEDLAKRRIANWEKNCPGWIEASLRKDKHLFQAFNLPSAYMEAGQSYCTYFALKDDPEALTAGSFVADLVTTPISTSITDAYYDFVRPVPPFDPLHFYLLTIAK
ncbi:MAG: hypothetical protein BGO31_09145 [Bacteroidetes bacterium 43-16]|nr:MAG: hypothetical protein BGO31_09145 [Bacteroidetes bacterium 43-16]